MGFRDIMKSMQQESSPKVSKEVQENPLNGLNNMRNEATGGLSFENTMTNAAEAIGNLANRGVDAALSWMGGIFYNLKVVAD